MTTWELATEAEKRELRRLVDRLRKAGAELPAFPATAQGAGFEGVTKRDAGVLRTRLREAAAEVDGPEG